VISNHLKFAEDGTAVGFLHKVVSIRLPTHLLTLPKNIHTFSKSEVILPELHETWGVEVQHRRNVLLCGDR
jgi:hypothetical protein